LSIWTLLIKRDIAGNKSELIYLNPNRVSLQNNTEAMLMVNTRGVIAGYPGTFEQNLFPNSILDAWHIESNRRSGVSMRQWVVKTACEANLTDLRCYIHTFQLVVKGP